MKKNPQIIFIISSGHSGSTLLDLLLGTLPGVVSTGELIWLPWQTWRDGKKCKATPRQDICTCLKTFRECPQWSQVLHHLSKQSGKDIFTDPLSYNMSFLRNKKYSSKKSYKYSMMRGIMTTAIIYNKRWIIDAIMSSQREEIKNTLLLYDNIAKTLKKEFIVDSSKDVLRAYTIWRERPESTKIILLYKDAKSFAASGKHWDVKGTMKNRLKKWIHQYQSNYIPILNKMASPILTFKYDQITHNPDMCRKKLANFIGIGKLENSEWHIDTRSMHIVAGNPMRFKGEIEIKYDDRWLQELNHDEIKLAEYYEQKMKNLISNLTKN